MSTRSQARLGNTEEDIFVQKQAVKQIKNLNRVLLMIVYMLFVVLIGISCLRYINKNLRSQMTEFLEILAEQKAAWVDNQMVTRTGMIEHLADELVAGGSYDFSNAIDDAKRIQEALGFYEVAIVDKQGDAYTSNSIIQNISDMKVFQSAIEGVPYISELLQNNVDTKEETTVSYSVPIIDYNKEDYIIGALIVTEKVEAFTQNFKQKGIQENSYTYIIDQNGDLIDGIFDHEGNLVENVFEKLKTDNRNQDAIIKIRRGVENQEKISLTYFAGEEKCVVGIPLKLNSWYMMMVVPKSIVNEQLQVPSYSLSILFSVVFTISDAMFLYIMIGQGRKHDYLQNVAYIDPITGLYNKSYLKDNMKEKISDAGGKKAALVIYNIQKFKVFNELYGTDVGNEVIELISNILKKSLKTKEEIALRGYADEFATLFFYEANDELEKRIKNNVVEIQRAVYSKLQIIIEIAVGIYEIEDVSYPFEQIYNYANLAKNKNKELSSGELTYYSKELVEMELDRKKLEDSIRRGIEKKEFKAWFQPQYNCQTKELVGCEALARWHTSDGRVLTPYYFIEVSEKSSLISEIDRLIFEDVCRQIKEWLDKGLPCVPTSINLSRAYLNSLDMIYELKSIVDEYGIPSELIQLEVTESAIVENEKVLKQIIHHMHNLGFKVLLDDFGVGYSSLMAINSMQFDVLKVDKSFVDAIDTKNGKCIMEYTIHLGRQLGMDIVVEGVEIKEQYDYLKTFGNIALQGYYFSKPVDKETMEQFLEEEKNKK